MPRLKTTAPAVLASAILLSTIAGPALAAGDPDVGGLLVDTWCSGCHGTESGPVSDAAPTLQDLARQAQRKQDWVRAWLANPHPPMPNLSLSRAEIEDIVSYLETLPTK